MAGFGPRLPWNLITGVCCGGSGESGWPCSGQTPFFPCILHGAHELIEIPRYIIEVAFLAVLFFWYTCITLACRLELYA
jgi:hypothetical protein